MVAGYGAIVIQKFTWATVFEQNKKYVNLES